MFWYYCLFTKELELLDVVFSFEWDYEARVIHATQISFHDISTCPLLVVLSGLSRFTMRTPFISIVNTREETFVNSIR